MGEINSSEVPWIHTRKAKAIVAGGIIATAIIAAIIIPLGVNWVLSRAPQKIYARNGDLVNFSYIGTYAENGTVFDSGTISNIVIGSNSLLVSFDQQLVGMEPGVTKDILVLAADGYPSGPLAGHDLNFETTITKLTRDGQVLYPAS